MNLGIEGRVAVVTGAAGGIGAAIAASLIDEGVRVVVADIDESRSTATADKLRNSGGDAIGVAVDVTAEASVAALFEKVIAHFGAVDILVNNAGFTVDRRLERMSETDWDRVVDVILKGSFFCSRAAAPRMCERNWGRIVNISSRAHLGNPGQANYSSAKSGLIGLTKSLALELGKRGVTVNAVAPGIVDTAAVRALDHFDKITENARRTLAIPRLGTVEDVSGAVLFLTSKWASYITGDILHVTGGRY